MENRRLSDIEARLNAGGIRSPWRVDEMGGLSALAYVFDADDNPVVANITIDRARFIANAPDDIRALIDDVRYLRKELAECQKQLNMGMSTVPVAAEELGIHEQTIYSAIHDGRLDAKRIGGIWIIEREEAERFVEEWKPRGKGENDGLG